MTITLEVDNPTKVLVNTPIVYLRWNYSVTGNDPLKEVDFSESKEGADHYIGYANAGVARVSSSFPSRDRFSIERPSTLIIRNVTASDAATYIFGVELESATKKTSSVYLDVLGKLMI